ncbi:MAG: hypothetical protein GQ542_19205 [Desulforhopalus sp.]|nr:hypothetical protein [Desulforhopalus sp.]
MREDKRWKYFECKRCGHCCTSIDLPHDPKSIFEIAEYLSLTVNDTIDKFYGLITEDGKHIEFQSNKRNPGPFLFNDSKIKKPVKFTLLYLMGAEIFLSIHREHLSVLKLAKLLTE